MRNKLLFSAVIIVLSLLGTTNADAQWMSMTSRIVNPSFESDEAAASFKDKERRTVTGWTLDYQNKEWTQYGTTSGSATSLGGVSSPPAATDGSKYLYLRTNWASSATLTVSPTLNGTLPAGYYRVSCKAYTFASQASAFGLSVQVGNDTPVTSNYNTANSSWQPWSVTIYKSDASTALTITASMTPGGQADGQNYGMLLDDFQLEYLEEGWNALTALPSDLNDYFYTIEDDGLTLTLGDGRNQGNGYKTLWYRANVSSETNRDALMTMVADGNYHVMTCANYPDYMLQAEGSNRPELYRTNDNGAGTLSWGDMSFNYADGSWTVQNGKYDNDNYWGAWVNRAGNPVDGDEIAANKNTTDRSTYDIYAIKRGKYLQNVLSSGVYENEDISYVITNPQAERRSTIGWTIEGDFDVRSNDNFTNKTNTYFFEKWQASGEQLSNRSMYQTLTEMKEGYYKISVTTNADMPGAYLFANDVKVDMNENKNNDGVVSVNVYVEDGGSLQFGVKLIDCQDNWVAFDNFKMYYSNKEIDDGIYYLYNMYSGDDQNRFLARGGKLGSSLSENGRLGLQAVVDKYGIPVRITNTGNNMVTIQFADRNDEYLGNTWWLYTDAGSNADHEKNTFKIIKSTVDGVEGYHFATYRASGNSLGDQQYMYVWLNDSESPDYYRVAGNSDDEGTINGDLSRTVWKLLSVSERNEIINRYSTDNMVGMMNDARSSTTCPYETLPPVDYPDNEIAYWIDVNMEANTPTEKNIIDSWNFTLVSGWDGGQYKRDNVIQMWNMTGIWTQTIENIPEGIYKLTFKGLNRHGTLSNDDTTSIYGNIGSSYMIANGQQVHIAAWNEDNTANDNPNSTSQAYTHFADGKYVNEVFIYVGSDQKLNLQVIKPGYVYDDWLVIDQSISLTYYTLTSKAIAHPEGEYYLRNKETGQYITFDGYWGTYYSMSDVGKRLTLKASSDGTTLMHTTYLSNTDDVNSSTDTENYFYSYPGNIEHAFSNGNSTEGGEKWVFYETNTAGVYSIMNYMTGYYLSGSNGNDTNSLGWGGLMKATDNDADTKWELVTKEQLTSALTANAATYPQDASFLIDEPDFIIGYNNVYKEFYSWKVMGNDQYKYSDWTDKNIISFYSQNNGVSTGNVAYAFSVASDYPDILQTIDSIPNGLYVVECQAMFRDGTEGPKSDNPNTSVGSSSRRHDDRLADGTYVNRAFLYANDDMKPSEEANQDARVMRDRYWIYDNAQMVPVHAAPAGLFEINNRNSHLKPQLLDEFRDGNYTVQLPVYVSTGKLTIGVLQQIGINENLLAFDRFRLKYYGDNISAAKDIAKGNLTRLQNYYKSTGGGSGYQSNAITTPEINKLNTAINNIDGNNAYSSKEDVIRYNTVAREYGETAINWYIFNVLKTDYDLGYYRTVAKEGQERVRSSVNNTLIRYPYVDEASKKEVVKYFGAGTDTNNGVSYYDTNITYQADTQIDGLTDADATLENLKAAISALRTYVESNAEVRYLEDEQVRGGFLADTEEARRISREARMALRSGRKENIVTEEGVRRRSYEINPVMFTNDGASVTAPEINMIMTNARCWAPRDAYHHRYFDYTNYYGQGPHTNEIQIEGLTTGKYLVTISESHNNELKSVKFNAWVGDNHIVEDEQLFHQDESVWQIYTHSWQDISCVIDITHQFEPVKLQFKGGGSDVGAENNATMNITNLRIYRMEDLQTLFLDEDATILAKNGMTLTLEENGVAYQGYHNVKTLLRRTMAKDQWNTLVLPVNLTKQQVIAAFGEGTILATMDGFSTDYGNPDNCIHFTTDDLSDEKYQTTPAIEEGKVYLIKPTADPAVSSDEQVYFKNKYENRNSYEPVNGPIYYLDYVDYHVTEGEKNPKTGVKVPHTAPSSELNPAYNGKGKQKDKLSLQMQGSYGKNVVPVDNGGTNYIYAFQQQSDGNVYLVELDPSKNKNYTLANDGIEGTGRLFKGYRGWAVANYTETPSTGARESYLVLLDEGDDQLTVIRGIDSEEGYSEVKIPRQGIYDLQGRRIDRKEFYSGSYPQGVYIVDGKKVVRK